MIAYSENKFSHRYRVDIWNGSPIDIFFFPEFNWNAFTHWWTWHQSRLSDLWIILFYLWWKHKMSILAAGKGSQDTGYSKY